ncbi:MAG TPA: AAA family ATPase, partial [Myxococcales bacterium]|nr:AAA family ATPase [Myxococcales bacterium]
MPLLEREAPLASLEKLWAEAQEGHGVLVFVGGEAGVGKTSLVREFAGRARGARVLLGACEAMSTPRPLGPLTDVATAVGGALLRTVVESAGPAASFAALLA